MLQTRRHTVLLKAFYYLTRAKPSHVLPYRPWTRRFGGRTILGQNVLKPCCVCVRCRGCIMHHALCIVHPSAMLRPTFIIFVCPVQPVQPAVQASAATGRCKRGGYDDACVATAQLGNDTTRHDTTQHSETSAVALTFSTPSSILFDFIPWTTPRRRFSG